MSTNSSVVCPTCNKSFTSRRYYRCHFKYPANRKCKNVRDRVATTPANVDAAIPPNLPQKRPSEVTQHLGNNINFEQNASNKRNFPCFSGSNDGSVYNQHFYVDDDSFSENDDNDPPCYDDDDGDLQSFPANDAEPSVDNKILEDFYECSQRCRQNLCPLTPELEAGIELMSMLGDARVPLHMYEKVFKWHLRHLKATGFIPQNALLEKLRIRHHLVDSRPQVLETITLPHSKARVNLVAHSFHAQVQSLLTDPRILDSDYLFFDKNNPFQPPPAEFTHVGDVNSGLAYRETYKRLIKDPNKQVLLPVIFYMDGAVTGQYDSLPIEVLKFTLGIFKQEARNRKCAWRELGYVTKFLAEETQGQDQIRQSTHIDARNYLSNSQSSDSDAEDQVNSYSGDEESTSASTDVDADPLEPVVETCSGQDLHAMLHTFLESYRDLEQTGFNWDLRLNGITHQIEFIPFVLFIKGDSVEHDKHCGSYTSRTQNIQQLCRYCCCPNMHTDEPYRRDKRKHTKMIQDLVDAGDEEGLKAISQQYLQNAWYTVRFGFHNNYGVHGACPLEMLHWLQLGKHKYLRKMFFAQTGKSSQLTKKLNTLAKMHGLFYKRNSDRDLPRTDFSKGLTQGKLMAHEMSGVILILCTVLRSKEGRRLLLTESRGNQKKLVGEMPFIKDWIMLLETMLQWEAWLKQPQIPVHEIKRFGVKVRELMNLEKAIGKREEGMKFRTFNFHASLHVADDMLFFGVPGNVNTSSDEMNHKPDKTAAKRTQRRPRSFDIQCANQMHSMSVVELGMHEVFEGRQKWRYFTKDPPKESASPSKINDSDGYEEDSDEQQEDLTVGMEDQSTVYLEPGPNDVKNGGTRCRFFYCNTRNKWVYTVRTRMKEKDKFKLEPDLCTFLATTVNMLGNDVKHLDLFTEHKRFDQIFRASPFFLGKPWHDWAMIDWGDGQVLPGQISIFIDLRDVPVGLRYEPSVYAVVESANPVLDKEEQELSQIFQPYIKEMKEGTDERSFYLVDVGAFYSPTCMIPDHGHENNAACLRLRPRSEWAAQFSDWLETPYERQFRR